VLGLGIRPKEHQKPTYSAKVFTGEKFAWSVVYSAELWGIVQMHRYFFVMQRVVMKFQFMAGLEQTHSTQIIQYVVLLTNSLGWCQCQYKKSDGNIGSVKFIVCIVFLSGIVVTS
jgi:hypothetical protein